MLDSLMRVCFPLQLLLRNSCYCDGNWHIGASSASIPVQEYMFNTAAKVVAGGGYAYTC